MNWSQPVDIYCERLDASFWAEPVNALSNIAFLVAAVFAYRRYQQFRHLAPKEVPFLIAMLGVVGIGSFLFHSFANVWSELADVLPILFFQILALWIFLRRLFDYHLLLCIGLIGLFVIISQGLSTYAPAEFLNGSAGYLPSLAAQCLIAWGLQSVSKKAARRMWLAGGIFASSLVLRSLDMAVCESIPLGTHFLWHYLNAVMLYKVVSATLCPRNTNQAPA